MGHETYISADEPVIGGKRTILRHSFENISKYVKQRRETIGCIKKRIDGESKAVRINLQKAFEIARDDDTVVIYPEVVTGNPLFAHKVARWVLFFPGVNGGEKVYDSAEFVFTYSPDFVENTIYKSVPLVRIIDTLIDNFFELNQSRGSDYLLIKKGSVDIDKRRKLFLDPEEERLFKLESADDIINQSRGISEYNLKLNRARFFISYDLHSYHSILAALAGCKSIVIPDIGVSEESFFASFPEAKIAGVSYGFQDLNAAPIRQKAFRLEKEQIEANNIQFTSSLTLMLEDFFF